MIKYVHKYLTMTEKKNFQEMKKLSILSVNEKESSEEEMHVSNLEEG